MPYAFEPIGFVRSPFAERADAPRQAVADGGKGVVGRIELLPGRGLEDALDGLGAFSHVWVLFVFHRNVEQARGWSPKVLPPRAARKVGVFASRSPHRPNPIGMSAVKLERVEGLVVHVSNLDLLDGTPVLDLKPYVPYADAYPEAQSGWLEARDPRPAWQVTFSDEAEAQLGWLVSRGVDLRRGIEIALSLGPQPHAYRRIRPHAGGMRLAMKEWRIDFTPADEGSILVRGLASGYRPGERETRAELGLHRDFAARFSPR
ncbi:MAG TPA: tRNA (N6-threonylcarbamoyladenosine(37)-N6)-methyltransferase TrmO [Polyangiaceae bacterium]